MAKLQFQRKFKVDFLENKASNEKFLFYVFDFFFRVESPPFRLYRQLSITLYICYKFNYRKLRSNILRRVKWSVIRSSFSGCQGFVCRY